ncbi:MAG: hypothetical protein HY804_14290 [Nitrospinae bacterium]|nr:hypothetical protein [Nitrospinota bacterium]
MTASAPPRPRRRYLITPSTQAKLAALYLAAGFILSLLATLELSRRMRAALEEAIYVSHMKASTTGQILAPLVVEVNVFFIAAFILVVAAVTWATLRGLDRKLEWLRAGLRDAARFRFHAVERRGEDAATAAMMDAYGGMMRALAGRFAALEREAALMEAACGAPGAPVDTAAIREALDRARPLTWIKPAREG